MEASSFLELDLQDFLKSFFLVNFWNFFTSIASSFHTLALMIQERPDFKTLDSSDILERLNTHEF